MGELGGVERLGQGADLVHLPEQRVGGARLDPLGEPGRVGHEQVVADDLDAGGPGQLREALEVVLVEGVLDRDDVVVADQLLVELDHRGGVAGLAGEQVAAVGVVMRGGAVEPVAEAAAVAGVGDRLVEQPESLLRARDRRCVAALVAGVEGALAVTAEEDLGEREVDLGRDLQRLEDRSGADRDDDELLEVEVVGGVLAAVDQVDERHRQDMSVAVQVPIERLAGGCGAGPGDGERDAEDRVGAEPALVGGAIELDQRRIERPLRGDVEAGERVGDLAVDGIDGAADAEAAEALAAVAALVGLVGAGRAPGGDVGATAGAVGEVDVHLHGRQAAAVEDLAGPQRLDLETAHAVTSSRAWSALVRFSLASPRCRRNSASTLSGLPACSASSNSRCSAATSSGRS
jgi:hypothetical protein